MLWQGRRETENVDDRRGITGGHVAIGGGILGVIALVVNFLLGGNGNNQLPLPNQNQPLTAEEKAKQDTEARFVRVVLADTEDIWAELMQKAGKTYTRPTLVLFNGIIMLLLILLSSP